MWDFTNVEQGQWYRWRLNGSTLAMRRDGDEWRVASRQVRLSERVEDAGRGEPISEEEVDALGPVSFVVARGRQVGLRPAMPDRPYLVTVKDPITLSPGAEARFALKLPVLFKAETEHGELLKDFLPYTLSKTWFGDTTGGTLCWSLPSALDPSCGENRARRCEEGDLSNSLAHCEIVLRNTTKAPIELKRVAVYVELLRVWESEGRILVDSVFVDGLPDGGLKMTVSENTPPGARLLASAKVGQKELMVRKGVAFLRTIAGI